jgi:transcriptional regulator with XRE-family HTH domain
MEGLRAMRKAAGLSMADLGRQLGVSAQAVARWENGSAWPSAWYIPRIAEILGCSMAALYCRPEPAGAPELTPEEEEYGAEDPEAPEGPGGPSPVRAPVQDDREGG